MEEQLTYSKLLDNLYSHLPKRTVRSERFEVPFADVLVVGTKTTIKNFDTICAYIRRQPAEVSKYLSKELAVPAVFEGVRLVLQGKFSARSVNDRIQTYVKNAVLCKQCGKPDTNIVESERSFRILECEACGARIPLRV